MQATGQDGDGTQLTVPRAAGGKGAGRMAQSVTWHIDPDGGVHILIVWASGEGCSLYVPPEWPGWSMFRR